MTQIENKFFMARFVLDKHPDKSLVENTRNILEAEAKNFCRHEGLVAKNLRFEKTYNTNLRRTEYIVFIETE